MGKSGPCGHCGVTSTPLWRNGPPDKPVLCNACGSRWRTRGNLTNYLPASLGGSGHGGGYYARGSKSAWCKSAKENYRKNNSSSFVVKAAQPKQVAASSNTPWTGEHLQNGVLSWKGQDCQKGDTAMVDNNGGLPRRPRLPTSCGRCDADEADVAVDGSTKTHFTLPVTVSSSLESIACMRRCDDAVEIADEREHFAEHALCQNGAGSGCTSVSIPSRKRSSTSRLRAAPKKTWAHISSLTTGFYDDPENHGVHEIQPVDGVTLAMGMPSAAPQTVLVQGIGLCNLVPGPAANPLSVIVPTRHDMITSVPEGGGIPGLGFSQRVSSPAHVGRAGDDQEGTESVRFTGVLRSVDALNLTSVRATDSGGEQVAAGPGDDLAREAADVMVGGKRTDSEGASVPSGAGESNGGVGEAFERTKKKVKKLDMSKGWHPEKRPKAKKVALLDEYPYNKRDVLSSCYSPLAYLELRDIVNVDTFMKMLSPQEQQDLMKLLPPDDVRDRRSLADMFNSCQFEASLVNFQHLLSEGMFDSSEMGPSARVFEHYQKLLTVVDLTSSGWMEGVTQLCRRSRRRGQASDLGKDEIDDAWMASEMAAFAERRASSHKASEGSSRKAHARSCADISLPEESAANERCLHGADSAVSSSNSREPSQWSSHISGPPVPREGAVADDYMVAKPVIIGDQRAAPPKDQNASGAHVAAAIGASPPGCVQSVAMGSQFWNTQWQSGDPVVAAQCIVSTVGTGNCDTVAGKGGKRPLDGGTESSPACISLATYAPGGGEGMPFVNSQVGMYGTRAWFKPPTMHDRLATGLQNVPAARGDALAGGIWAASSSIIDPDRYVAIPVPSAVASVSIASPLAVPVPVPDFIRVVETVDDSAVVVRPRSSAKAERHPQYNRACEEECTVSCSSVAAPAPHFNMNCTTSPLDALLYNGVVRVVGSAERPECSGVGRESTRKPATTGGVAKAYSGTGTAAPVACNGADHGLMYTVQVDPRKISYAQALPVMHTHDMLIVPNAAAFPTMLMTGDGWQMYTDPMWENILWANQGCAGQDRRLLNGPVLYQGQIP